MFVELLFLFLWSSGYIGAKLGVPLAGTFTLLFLRYSIVLLVVGAVVTFRKQWRRPNVHTLLLGFFGHFVWLSVILLAFENGVNAGSAALIAALQPAITALAAPFVVGESLSKKQWAGLVLGFVGVFVVVRDNLAITDTQWWFYLLPMIATLCLSFVTLWERRSSFKTNAQMPIMTSLFWQCVITIALLLPFAVLLEGFEVQWTARFVFSVVWLALVVSVAAYGLMFYLIRNRSSSRVSALQYYVPAVTMVIAYLVFGETLTISGIIGFFITCIGFFLLSKSD